MQGASEEAQGALGEASSGCRVHQERFSHNAPNKNSLSFLFSCSWCAPSCAPALVGLAGLIAMGCMRAVRAAGTSVRFRMQWFLQMI